ncbi:hypothetical protein ACHWQZ_G006979 [Mnemiopsis leidyi]
MATYGPPEWMLTVGADDRSSRILGSALEEKPVAKLRHENITSTLTARADTSPNRHWAMWRSAVLISPIIAPNIEEQGVIIREGHGARVPGRTSGHSPPRYMN